jgi:hypothetical protein
MAAAQQQRWASQAAVNALLRTQPQREGLADLQRAAGEKFASSVAAAKSEGALGTQAANAAIPATQQIFASSAKQGERGAALSSPVLAALAANSPFKAAAANEQSAGTERRANTEASALSRLQQEKVSAANLPAYGRQAALAQLVKDLGGITGKQEQLNATQGADVQSEIDKQRTEANKLAAGENASKRSAATSTANSERSAATSTANSQRTAATSTANSQRTQATAQGKNAKGQQVYKPLPSTAQLKGAATLREIEHEVRQAHQENHPAGQILQELTQEHPAINQPKMIPEIKNGKPTGKAVPLENSKKEVQYEKAPALPKRDQLLSEAAIDSVLNYGRVSKATLAKLHKAGYSLSALQLQGPVPAPPQVQSTAPGSRISTERNRKGR